MAGPVREIEGARANGEPFFLMAGAGLDGEIIARLSHSVKQRVGKAAYAMPVLGALSHRQGILECDVDGQRHEAGWIVVAKSRCYGGSFVIAPDAGVLKPGLVAVLFKSDSRIVRVRQLLALATGALARDPSVTMIPCTRVDVASARPQRVEIDGDEFGATPLKIVAGGPRAALILPSRTP
jgi:diacylglycerol kinase family enzyme